MKTTESQEYKTLDEAIYAAISHCGIDIVKDPSRLSAVLSDFAYSIPKEVRIFKKTFVNGFDDYSSYLSLAFESEPTAYLPTLKRFRHLLINEEGLSEGTANMLCYSIYSASCHYQSVKPLSLDEVFSDKPTPAKSKPAPKPKTAPAQKPSPKPSKPSVQKPKQTPATPSKPTPSAGRVSIPPVSVPPSSTSRRDTVRSLIGQGNGALASANWGKAKVCFEHALREDSTAAEAYLGLAMAEAACRNREEFRQAYTDPKSKLPDDLNVLYAQKYADPVLLLFFDELSRKTRERKASEKEDDSFDFDDFETFLKEMGVEPKRGHDHFLQKKYSYASKIVSCGVSHIVALTEEGTVLAAGDNDLGQCNVQNWTNIIAVTAGCYHTVGVKRDGTVVTCGRRHRNHMRLSNWTDIVAVAAGEYHTVGLKADGTCVVAGDNPYGQCDVSDWRDIIAIAANYRHTVGLRKDGTVLAVGQNDNGECNVSEWRDIVDVKAGLQTTVGLKSDGTVIVAGSEYHDCQSARKWKNIIAIAANQHTIGLQANGRVIAARDSWNKLCNTSSLGKAIAISDGYDFTVALAASGKLVAFGRNSKIESAVSGWKLFSNYDSMMANREKVRKDAISALNAEKAQLQSELPGLTGFFSGSRRRAAEARLAQIDRDLVRFSIL